MTFRVACGRTTCSKTAEFRIIYRSTRGRLLAVNRCREHRHLLPKGATRIVKIECPPIQGSSE